MALNKRRKFNGKWYDLDFTAEKQYWRNFDERLARVRRLGHRYRVIVRSYPQFGTYRLLYVRR